MAAPASASASAIEAGHNVGPYTLTREIGKGSFAVVFQGKVRATPSAFDATGDDSVEDVGGSQQSSLAAAAAVATSPVTRVAIKIVTRKKLTAKLLDNLEGEISILRTVRHVNIVELIDCLKTSSHIYLVMQYCRMGDLSNWIRSRRRTETPSSQPRRPDPFEREVDLRYTSPHDGGLHADVTRSFLAQLASALQFMRGKNIVHRDIKPQNLLLQEPESEILAFGHPAFIPQLKVADFGFARHLEAASLAETLCGSPLYMAPEILRYEKYDAKADLWSVGAVLFEMSVGKPPFKATNHVELLRKIERGEDKIKFPDERSDDSLRREQARKTNDDVRDVGEIVRPHTVDEDIKRLIRALLRRRPIERLSFDDFFLSDVLTGYKRKTDAAIEASLSVPSPLHGLSRFSSPSSSGITPIARRVAPAAPSQTAPAPSPAPVSPAVDSQAVSPTTPSVHPSSASPADATIPPASPSPINAAARHYFAPKYVVGGARKSTSVSVRTVDSAPPAVVAEQAPPRPTLSTPSAARLAGVDANEGDASSLEDNVLETPGSSVTHLPSTASRATTVTPGSHNAGVGGASSSAAASLKESRRSSGNDDDRGYVMVEKRNVEINALAEEMANKGKIKSIGWSPLGVVRRPSQLGRLASMSPLSALSGAAHYAVSSSQPQQPSQASTGSPRISPVMTPSKQVQGFAAASAAGSASPTFAPASRNSPTTVSPLQARFGSTPPNAPFAVPPGARKPSFSRRTSNNAEGARLAAVAAAQQMSPRPSLLPLVASSAPVDSAMALVGGQSASSASPPSSTLARAISMASVRLFGVPTGMSMRGAGIRRSLRMGLGPGTLLSSSPGQIFDAPLAVAAGNDVAEQNLLSLLHEYGQKSFVLSEFADARLGAYFAEGPHQNSHVVDDNKRRTSSSSSLSGAGGGNSSSSGSTTNAATASAQVAACEAYVLYVRSLSFLQRALDAARDYVEARTLGAGGSRYSVQHAASSSSLLSTTATGGGGGGGGASQDVTDAVRWLRAKFHDGVDRANFARSKSGEDLPESAQYIDKMIFDQALEIARGAAMEELEHASRSSDDASAAATARSSTPVASQWNVERCLLAYETACTMLQGLLDPDEAVKDLSASAVGTIEKFVVSITKRMLSIQRKYQGMSAAIMA